MPSKVYDGTPPKKRGSKPVVETALPEPQIIKRELLADRYAAADILAHILYRRRFNASVTMSERKFEEKVISLFIKLCSKDDVRDWDDYEKIRNNIINGTAMLFPQIAELYFRLCDIMQKIGIEKIEFVKTLKPEFAWAEEDILAGVEFEG
jgi:hypothetical protein